MFAIFKKGCLRGKTEKQKEDFFNSLYNFYFTDRFFFKEQYNDLLFSEKAEFQKWLTKRN